MEVMIPSPSMEFDFSSARSSPYVLTAPSTPKRFGKYYFSTPTSPTHMADFYQDFDEFSIIEKGFDASSSSNIPFGWEEKPGKPKSPKGSEDEEEDFAFSVCEDSERASVSAEELFDGGKIRPLKPPPRLQLPKKNKGRSTEAAMEKALKRKPEKDRGRDRAPGNGPGPRAARSVSPYRVSSYPWEEEKEKQQLPKLNNNNNNNSNNSSISSSKGSGSGSKKWRLKNLFLFRSASEGRATDEDPFRKYAAVFRRQEEIRNSSFRSATESSSPGSISRRRSGPVSAHELHYTVNKAVSEDLKKRTFLPYKQGILGRLAFNPAVSALANGFGSLYR